MIPDAQAYPQGVTAGTHSYTVAGWLAIAAGVLFPVGFGIAIVSAVVGARAFNYHGPIIGPSDFVFWIQSAFVIYALYMFRRLLNERFEFREINTLIMASIIWTVLFTVIGFVLKLFLVVSGLENSPPGIILMSCFLAVAFVTIGIIDIMIAARLLRDAPRFTDLVKGFAYVTMVSGVCEVSVFLIPLAALLVPVSCILLGLILLRANKEVEFV